MTYDGLPISTERPYGAVIVVSCTDAEVGTAYLLLHRAHHGPDFDGDWAWTPPAGSRFPDEDVAVFRLEIDPGTPVVVDGTEDDRLEWVSFDEACRRCRPAVVVEGLRAAQRSAARPTGR